MPNPWGPPPAPKPKGQHARYDRLPSWRPGQRRLLPVHCQGVTVDDPILVGAETALAPVLVEATGALGDIRKGERRWVTGDGVRRAVERGVLIVVEPP